MIELPRIRHQQCGVFTSAQARWGGLSRHQVRLLLEAATILALRRGVYVEKRGYEEMSAVDQSCARAVAACLARPGTVVSHHSAALVHALPLIGSRPAVPALTFAARRRRHADSDRTTMVRSAALPPEQIEVRGAWSVTSVARTVCDVVRQGPSTVGSVVLVDAALSRRQTTIEELCAVRDHCSSWPGSQALRSALRQADGFSESPYESVARFQLIASEIVAIPQVWGYDDFGPIGCGDLWLPGLWTFLEVDGDIKYADDVDTDTLLDEKLRQERMEDAGFGVARVSARKTREVSHVLRQVHRAAARGRLARAASPGSPGYVGPPPPWAGRGTAVEYQSPPA